MEFLTKLKRKNGVEEFLSEGIEFNNNIILSIQGSGGHYCRPREILPYEQYVCMEMAIIKGNNFVSANDIKLQINELEQYFSCGVYGYVPVELIEKLYQALKSKYGLKE